MPTSLRITSSKGTSDDTRVELDGQDITKHLVGISLKGAVGKFWRASFDVLATVDIDVVAVLEAHTAERRQMDTEVERREKLHAALAVLQRAVTYSDAPDGDWAVLQELTARLLEPEATIA